MPAGRAFDHIVLVVHSLDQAAGTYEDLGFTLTPRARHEDRMGTSNRLVQLAEQNFIEILEVDRPDGLAPTDSGAQPPVMGWGLKNKAFLDNQEGISFLVFQTEDARDDLSAWDKPGITAYAPFDFERLATLPDGNQVTVSFSLGFATSPEMADVGFFVCQNRAKEYFWKPDFQAHSNGATGMRTIYLASPDPERDAAFCSSLFDGEITEVGNGSSVACGAGQDIRVMTPANLRALHPSIQLADDMPSRFVGISIATANPQPFIPADAAHGIFIEWIET